MIARQENKISDPRDKISIADLKARRKAFEALSPEDRKQREAEIAEAIAECIRTGNSPEAVARLNKVSPHTYIVK